MPAPASIQRNSATALASFTLSSRPRSRPWCGFRRREPARARRAVTESHRIGESLRPREEIITSRLPERDERSATAADPRHYVRAGVGECYSPITVRGRLLGGVVPGNV